MLPIPGLEQIVELYKELPGIWQFSLLYGGVLGVSYTLACYGAEIGRKDLAVLNAFQGLHGGPPLHSLRMDRCGVPPKERYWPKGINFKGAYEVLEEHGFNPKALLEPAFQDRIYKR